MSFEGVNRVTDAWIEAEEGGYKLNLDLAGVTQGYRPQLVDGATFALVAAMLAVGPAYFKERSLISTDPYFGTTPVSEQPFERALEVVEAGAMWDFETKQGRLIMILENRSIAHLEMNDPGGMAGWLMTARVHDVTFDGTSLKSRQHHDTAG